MFAAIAVPGHSQRLSALLGNQEQSLPALVTPIRSVDLAAQVEGDVTEIYVREGDTVLGEQFVARIDDRIPTAQVHVAQAAARCEAGIELAESELRQMRLMRDRMLAAKALNAVAAADVDQAVADYELAEARLKQAHEQCRQKQSQLELDQAHLNAHVLRAPFDGEVLRIEQHAGSAVGQGSAIVRIADISRLRAIVYVPFSWFDQICVGQQLRLTASAPVHRLLAAEVASIEPVIDAATETFRCVVEIDNSDRILPSGFAVTLEHQHLLVEDLAAAH